MSRSSCRGAVVEELLSRSCCRGAVVEDLLPRSCCRGAFVEQPRSNPKSSRAAAGRAATQQPQSSPRAAAHNTHTTSHTHTTHNTTHNTHNTQHTYTTTHTADTRFNCILVGARSSQFAALYGRGGGGQAPTEEERSQRRLEAESSESFANSSPVLLTPSAAAGLCSSRERSPTSAHNVIMFIAVRVPRSFRSRNSDRQRIARRVFHSETTRVSLRLRSRGA